MAFAAFFVLALKRLKSRASLSLLLTGATALVIALITCIPAFSGAVSLRIMQQELAERAQRHQQPPLSARIYAMGTPSQPIAVQQALDYGAWARDRLERALDLPIDSSYTQVESPLYPLQPRSDDAHYTEVIDRIAVTVVPGISAYMNVVSGQPFGSEGGDAALRVWVEKTYADRIGLREGEGYLLSVPDEELVVEIAGLWEPIDPSARFWYLDPSGQMNHTPKRSTQPRSRLARPEAALSAGGISALATSVSTWLAPSIMSRDSSWSSARSVNGFPVARWTTPPSKS